MIPFTDAKAYNRKSAVIPDMKNEDMLKELTDLFKQASIEVKYGKGYFDGGLYRYRDTKCIYLNRANTDEYNIQILLAEIKKMDWQSMQISPLIRELLTKSDQN